MTGADDTLARSLRCRRALIGIADPEAFVRAAKRVALSLQAQGNHPSRKSAARLGKEQLPTACDDLVAALGIDGLSDDQAAAALRELLGATGA